jgi:hypothetical protein
MRDKSQKHGRETSKRNKRTPQKKLKTKDENGCKQAIRLMKRYLAKWTKAISIKETTQSLPPLLSTHHSSIRLTSFLLNSLNRSLESIHALELVNIRIQFRVISCIDDLQSLLASLQRERHQDVNGSELVAAEETSTAGCSGELRFQEVKVGLEVWLEVHGFESGDNTACDGSNEEGDLVALEDCRSDDQSVGGQEDMWTRLLTAENEVGDHQSHQRALSIVHEEAVTQPFFSLETRSFLAILVFLGCEVRSKVVGQVLGDKTRLGKDQRISSTRSGDADYGRFAQRVNLLQLGRCEHFGGALEDFDVVVDIAFFEKPDEALSSGFIEPDG